MTWNRDDGLCMNAQKEHRVKCDQHIHGTQDVVHEWQCEGVKKDRVLGKGCLCAVQVQSECAVPAGEDFEASASGPAKW